MLKDFLSQMGMPIAFQPRMADFSGIDGSHDLWISNVIHKAFISVNEAGTEASASSGGIIGLGGTYFYMNKPFIFFIRDINTGTILFMGRIMNPLG